MLSNLPIVMVAMTYIAALFTGVDGHRDTVSCLCHLNIKLRRYLRPSLCWDVNAPYVGSLPTFRVIPSVPLRRKTTTKIGCVIYLHIHIYACKIMVIALFKNAVVCGCVNTAFDILKVVEHFSVKFKRHLIFLCFNAVSFFPSD